MTEGFSFWAAAIVPAVAAFLLNLILRGKEVLKSSSADWILLILVFDLTGAYAIDELRKHVPNIAIQNSLLALMLTSIAVTLVLWVTVVLKLEPVLKTVNHGWRNIIKLIAYAAVWMIVIALTASHVLIFLQKEGVQ